MYKACILGEMVEDTFEDMGDDVSMEVRSTADPRVVIAKERWSGSGMFLPDVAHSSSLGMFHCRRRKRCKRSLEVAGDVLEKLPGGVPRSQKEAMTKEEAEVAAAAKLLGAEA